MAVRGSNSLYFETSLDNSGLQQGASQATGIIQNLAGSIASLNPFAILATGAITAFATIASSAYNMMREFEQAMKEVETISKATQENFKGISAEVFAISKTSPDAPAKLAKAYYQIVSAGYDGAEGMRLLETASKAATAGVTNTETAADGITTVLNAFKLEAQEADEVADAMFTTVKLGKTTFEELSSTLSQAAPLAAATGFSYQELLAAVSSLTKMGVPTAQAMTQIRSGIESVSEVLGDGAAKSMTLQNAFQAIYDKAGGSQTKLKELTGRVEAMSAVLGIAGDGAKGAAEDLEELGRSAGAAGKAFDSQMKGNINQWEVLGNRIRATTADIGNSIVEISSGIAKVMNKALDDVESVSTRIRKQANEYNILRRALEDVNTPFDEKLRILKQLKEQYPEYLQSLVTDEINNDNLEGTLRKVAGALKDINDEQERRIKISGASQKRLNAEANAQDYKALYNQQRQNFYNIIEDIKDYAAKEDIVLNFNPNDDIYKIYRDIQSDLKVTNPFGEGGQLLADLFKAQENASKYAENLSAANKELVKATENEENVKRATFDNADGYKTIVEEIKKINSIEALNPFRKYEFPDIVEAVAVRDEIISAFSQIDLTKDIQSLKPFLDSEKEEIRKYAEERERMLTKGIKTPLTPEVDPEAYDKLLKERKRQYETYQAVVNQIGEDAAKKQFASLMAMGVNYGEFLQNQLKETTSAARQQAIAVAAEASGLRLNRGTVTSVGSLTPAPIVLDFKVNQTSINYIQRQITKLRRQWEEASAEDRAAIEAPLKMWQERYEAATKGLRKEEDLYNDVYRALSEMTFQSLRDYIKYWKERLKEVAEGSEKEKEILGKIADANAVIWQKHITQITESLSQISGSLRELGADDMADLIDGLRNVGQELEGIFRLLDDNATAEDKLMAGISGAIGLADMLISSTARRRKSSEDYYNSVIAQQKEYNRLLNEQLRTTESASDNVFTTDYINEIERGIEALREANASYQDSLNALAEGQAVAGQRDAINWDSVLSGAGSGAALGAAIGSIIPGLGTIIGGAVGAIAGGIAGIFGGRERRNEFTDLLSEYPELVEQTEDGVNRLNVALAQTLIEQELVNEATAALLEDAIAWQEQIEAAREQIAGVVDELAGGLGDNLRNSLVDAFQSGADAAVAMGDTISEVLQDVLAQLIFDEIFAAQFKKLQEDMTASFDVGGDRSWQDDFAKFFQEAQQLTDDFNQQLADARDIAQNNGFDIFGPDQSNRQGLAGAITNITEDTANLLAGYLNALRLDVRAGYDINVQSMQYLAQITVNTGYLVNIDRTMTSMDGRMATVERGILEFEAQG